jgi:hypothetical protein
VKIPALLGHGAVFLMLCTCFDIIPVRADMNADAPIAQREKAIAAAEVAIADFKKDLKSALINAMAQGGAESAIPVCSEKAPQIADTQSKMHDVTLRRTSLRWRNPDNAPSETEKFVLEAFEKKKREGIPVADLTYYHETEDGLMYMKAIPMQAMCAACHGTKVNKRLDEKIKTYYPDDRATGFEEGDIRGAFSVLIKKSP